MTMLHVLLQVVFFSIGSNYIPRSHMDTHRASMILHDVTYFFPIKFLWEKHSLEPSPGLRGHAASRAYSHKFSCMTHGVPTAGQSMLEHSELDAAILHHSTFHLARWTCPFHVLSPWRSKLFCLLCNGNFISSAAATRVVPNICWGCGVQVLTFVAHVPCISHNTMRWCHWWHFDKSVMIVKSCGCNPGIPSPWPFGVFQTLQLANRTNVSVPHRV